MAAAKSVGTFMRQANMRGRGAAKGVKAARQPAMGKRSAADRLAVGGRGRNSALLGGGAG